jgi:hypothetical protein
MTHDDTEALPGGGSSVSVTWRLQSLAPTG